MSPPPLQLHVSKSASPSSPHRCFSSAYRKVQWGEALLPGNSSECMIKTLISNLSPERLMWLLPSDALQSSWDGLIRSSFTHAKWIFTVKWQIRLTWRRSASSSTSSTSSYTLTVPFLTEHLPTYLGSFCDFWWICLLLLHIRPLIFTVTLTLWSLVQQCHDFR